MLYNRKYNNPAASIYLLPVLATATFLISSGASISYGQKPDSVITLGEQGTPGEKDVLIVRDPRIGKLMKKRVAINKRQKGMQR